MASVRWPIASDPARRASGCRCGRCVDAVGILELADGLLCLRSHDPVDRPRVEPFLLQRLLNRSNSFRRERRHGLHVHVFGLCARMRQRPMHSGRNPLGCQGECGECSKRHRGDVGDPELVHVSPPCINQNMAAVQLETRRALRASNCTSVQRRDAAASIPEFAAVRQLPVRSLDGSVSRHPGGWSPRISLRAQSGLRLAVSLRGSAEGGISPARLPPAARTARPKSPLSPLFRSRPFAPAEAAARLAGRQAGPFCRWVSTGGAVAGE